VQLGGFGTLHAAFLNESRTRGRVQCGVQEIRVRLLYLLSERLFPLITQVELFPPQGEGTIIGKQCLPGDFSMTDFQIILSTCADREQAERIAHRLLELNLAACINILPGVQSLYRWQGSVETAAEVLLFIKTRAALSHEVQSTIAGLHSYEVPEFLVLPISGGSEPYLAWLDESLR
jgi:periplasmic divalent cation tolerance protein